jgi:anaerobic dimethyl sulfoxide reductase subunit B (iron-sulfur subunit)
MGPYAFYFDSASCSGCKACQVACKDKHGLEVGRLWRRVYEVNGGAGWRQEGPAWQPDVFAYYLSIACNHCEKPICAEVCPARAISRRSDGIVLIDPSRCLGCRYCSWACPYGALQYDRASGVMTKCTFCADNLEAGLPPACVAACPLRCLDFGLRADLETLPGALREVPPLVSSALTEPALLIAPHPKTPLANQSPARVANQEEIPLAHSDERPLVLFTMLSQTAVGICLALAGTYAWIVTVAPANIASLARTLMLGVSLLMGAALLVSLYHLGNPLRAYHAIDNGRSSWLSREIFLAVLFTVLSVTCALTFSAPLASTTADEWWPVAGIGVESANLSLRAAGLGVAAIVGLALVYSMARVYAQRTIAAWDTPFTIISFFSTSLGLGCLATVSVLASGWIAIPAPLSAEEMAPGMRVLLLVSAAAQLAGLEAFYRWLQKPPWAARPKDLTSDGVQTSSRRAIWLRLGSGSLAVAILCLAIFLPGAMNSALLLSVFVLALLAETTGRWLFYNAHLPT